MALSGSFSSSIESGHYKLRIDWSATQNVANNTSKITAVMYLVNDWRINISTRSDNSTSIAGVAKTWSSPAINGTGTTKLGTVTSDTITHKADGTAQAYISATFYVRATLSGTYYEKITASQTVTLNTIPRATTPTLSASSADMGTSITIRTPRASSSFTHDLAYSFAGGSYVSIATGVATSKTWTVADVASKIPNATSGTMTIRCITKNGSTTIGTKTVLLTAKVPASVVPSINTLIHSEAVAGMAVQFGHYIQSKSKLALDIGAAGSKGSTIKSYSTTFDGKTYTGSQWTSGVISRSGTLNLVTTVTDSRGRTAKQTLPITVLAYTAPKISAFKVQRCNSAGAVDETNGTYAKLTLTYAVASLNSSNTAAVKVEYRSSTASEYSALISKTGAALSGSSTYLPTGVTFPTDNQYTMRLTVTDWFGASSAYTAILPSGAVVLDLKADGLGIAFGKTAEQTGVDFGWSAKGAVLGLWQATQYVQEGDNLNDYTQPGVYGIPGNDIAQSLTNCPTILAGTLRVWSGGGLDKVSGEWAYIMQEYHPIVSREPVYRRQLSTDASGAWIAQEWQASTLRNQKVLWSGAYFMGGSHTATLSEKVSQQDRGIVLVFSYYAGSAKNYDFNFKFIPKEFVKTFPGAGSEFFMVNPEFTAACVKYLYIHDDKIVGYDANATSGTGSIGITFKNNAYVLRYVIGV